MTASFWIVAALLCAVAAAVLLVPVVLHKRRGGRWSPAGLAAAVC